GLWYIPMVVPTGAHMPASRAAPRPSHASRTSRATRATSEQEDTTQQTVERVSVARGKLFANGRSQAVRLPKECRLPGEEVLIRREGNRLILEPVDTRGWPIELWDRIDALAAGFEEEWRRPADPVPPPIQRERDLP